MISDTAMETRIRAACLALKTDRMPTSTELRSINEGSLMNHIVRQGGFDHWADRLLLPRATHASRVGWEWETWFSRRAQERGLTVEPRGRVKSSWDVRVHGQTVDVKFANGAHISNGMQWTWRVAKPQHDVDLYALIAGSDDGPRVYIVPAAHVPLTCLTTRGGGRLERWRDLWTLFDTTRTQ